MEQFGLKKYLANPTRKVVTRDGYPVRIICTDRKDLNFPIITLIEKKLGGAEVIYAHTKDGIYCDTVPTGYDLFFAPEKHEGWINIYRSEYDDYYQGKIIYSSKEDAIKRGKKTPSYITTTKIEWEE